MRARPTSRGCPPRRSSARSSERLTSDMDGRVCGACSASCADDARFCSQCAAPLEAVRPDQPAAVREERRQITVLFSDASGYTQMAEDLDPEVVRDVMGLVYAKADAIVEKYGGRIDKLM